MKVEIEWILWNRCESTFWYHVYSLIHFHFISSSLVSLTNKYYITSSLYSIIFTSFALLPKWTFTKRSLRFTPDLYQSILLMILNNNGFGTILWKSLCTSSLLFFFSHSFTFDWRVYKLLSGIVYLTTQIMISIFFHIEILWDEQVYYK